jgi:hypothetical protein
MTTSTTFYRRYDSEVWTGVTSNSTSTSMPPTHDSSSYYEQIAVDNMAKALADQIDEDILKNLSKIDGRKYPHTREYIKFINTNAFKTVRFNPDNLWSEPKCLKQDTAQSVKEKLQSDITPPIKTLQLEMDKSLGTIFTKE